MQHDPRPHIRRRRAAIDRLGSLTAGAAVVGTAGIAGFGVLAAASWSGDPAATPLPVNATTDDGTIRTDDGSGTGTTPATPRTGVQPVAPNGAFVQPPTVTGRVNRGSGHATSGGSN